MIETKKLADATLRRITKSDNTYEDVHISDVPVNIIDGENIDLKTAFFSGLVGFTFSIIPYANTFSENAFRAIGKSVEKSIILETGLFRYSIITSVISAILSYLFGED